MMQLAKEADTEETASISNAVLNLLLDEIKTKKSIELQEDLNDVLTKQAIEYISDNLTKKLSIEEIAHHLNVSTSTLMHTFKQNMNISIHKYIIKKD